MNKIKHKEAERKKVNNLFEKLYLTKFKPYTNTHIKTNPDVCETCINKECTKFCPSKVFNWSEVEKKLFIAYENCLECGACKSGCPYEVIEYKTPKAGYGVSYSHLK